MLSNHKAWQPDLTKHPAHAKIKVTTCDLTRGWENLVEFFIDRGKPLADYYAYAIKTISSQ